MSIVKKTILEEEYNTKKENKKTVDMTELEKIQELKIKALEEEINKLEIENNLMRELLRQPVHYTYGVR